MIFVQDSLGAQEADTVQHVISAAGAPQDTLGSRVDLQAVSETVTEAEGMPIPYSPRTDDGLAMILLGCFFVSAYVLARSKKFLLQQVKVISSHCILKAVIKYNRQVLIVFHISQQPQGL